MNVPQNQRKTKTDTESMYLCVRNYSQGTYSLSSPTVTQEYTEPITNKWLHGDIIDIRTQVVQHRDAKAHKSIVGIIDFLNRIRMGMTPRGVPLYNFHPYDPAYPTMLVASKLKPTENMVAIASFEHWNDKHPRVGIQHIFGPVGDQKAEAAALRMGVSIPKKPVDDGQEEATIAFHTRHHDTSPWDIIFNIDPPGCEDVDDVMGWRRTAKGTDFFIGIVDIAAWIPEGSLLDEEAKAAGQTVYVDGKAVEPMFPNYLSTHKASLRADGIPRPVVALVYRIEGNRVATTQWMLLKVVVSHAYTYESVLENPDICTRLPELLSVITEKPAPNDPHVWVEQAMILYNTKVAEVLKDNHKGVLRKHAGVSSEAYTRLADKTGMRELAFLGASGGQYVNAIVADTGHAGLGLTTYCHASSPLRRYSDVINHRWLKYLMFGFQEPQTITMSEHLNHRAQMIKQFERLLWFLTHLNPDGSITVTTGIVLTYNPEDTVAKVYVPQWKRVVRAVSQRVDGSTCVYEPGQDVILRAFSNLKATSIYQRVVCSMN